MQLKSFSKLNFAKTSRDVFKCAKRLENALSIISPTDGPILPLFNCLFISSTFCNLGLRYRFFQRL